MKYTKQTYPEVWASAGSKTTPASLKIQTGWTIEKPAVEYMNWLQNKQDTMLAYINQQGIVEWDNITEYQNGSSFVQYNGVVYKSIQTGTNKQPDTQPTYWEVAFAVYGNSSETFSGTIEIATQSETNTGSDDERAVTPAKLSAYITQRLATETVIGAAEIATQSETNTGTDDARIVTPVKLKGYLDNRASSETVQGTIEIATQSETNSGSDDARAITALKLKTLLDNRTATDILTGLIELATQGEVDTGSDSYRAVVPSTLHGGSAFSLSANGYVKLPSWLGGLIVQWGNDDVADGSTVSFPISFPTVCYGVFGNDFGGSNVFGVSGFTTGGFTLNTNVGTLAFNYFAIGK